MKSTIARINGESFNLGNQHYVVMRQGKRQYPYPDGTIVRPISGIEGSTTPGHHWDKKFMTVCSINAVEAEFCGIEITKLILITNMPTYEN